MIQPIVHDELFLQQKAKPFTNQDKNIIADLKDTLIANQTKAVGIAANMIGKNKNAIVFSVAQIPIVMLNPKIIANFEPYDVQEGCLSLKGLRQTKRFKTIKVKYQDEHFKWHTDTLTDFTAQIIQHEIDHCNGILI